jgi:hypothetical protein
MEGRLRDGIRNGHTINYIFRGYAAFIWIYDGRSSGTWYIERYHRRVSKEGCLHFKRCFLDDN